ncbi:hypothetical protein L1887_55585 [Cichorium endivia]|nr:hypothetical protein L1887_55585 [Cichorium endivia]
MGRSKKKGQVAASEKKADFRNSRRSPSSTLSLGRTLPCFLTSTRAAVVSTAGARRARTSRATARGEGESRRRAVGSRPTQSGACEVTWLPWRPRRYWLRAPAQRSAIRPLPSWWIAPLAPGRRGRRQRLEPSSPWRIRAPSLPLLHLELLRASSCSSRRSSSAAASAPDPRPDAMIPAPEAAATCRSGSAVWWPPSPATVRVASRASDDALSASPSSSDVSSAPSSLFVVGRSAVLGLVRMVLRRRLFASRLALVIVRLVVERLLVVQSSGDLCVECDFDATTRDALGGAEPLGHEEVAHGDEERDDHGEADACNRGRDGDGHGGKQPLNTDEQRDLAPAHRVERLVGRRQATIPKDSERAHGDAVAFDRRPIRRE